MQFVFMQKQSLVNDKKCILKVGMGLVIDSTARDVKNIVKQRKLLQDLGYETAMVFVNTSLETALDRNRQRERSIPDNIVQSNHATVRKNMGKLQIHLVDKTFLL